MEHEGTYYGYRMIVTSTQEKPGSWTYRVEVCSDGGSGQLLSNTSGVRYASADAADRAAMSAAAAAIDQMRAGTGKP